MDQWIWKRIVGRVPTRLLKHQKMQNTSWPDATSIVVGSLQQCRGYQYTAAIGKREVEFERSSWLRIFQSGKQGLTGRKRACGCRVYSHRRMFFCTASGALVLQVVVGGVRDICSIMYV